jgi:hypothetical protein
MHRFILDAQPGEIADHRSGKGWDNRRQNLRLCSPTENSANRHFLQSKTSDYKGVHLEAQTGRWRAEITAYGKRYRLGRFKTQDEAAKAYAEKADQVFGEFAMPFHSK